MQRTGTISHLYSLDEHHLYAAARLGMETYQNITLADVQITTLPFGTFVTPFPVTVNDEFAEVREVKMKRYELNSHQSSVHITISDRKLSVQQGTTTQTAFYTADVVSWADYYSFGMQKPGRFGSEPDAKYRYKHQGQESDNEWAGEGNSIDFGARMYDPRLGRWRLIDAHAGNYPSISPYVFVNNMPLIAIDPDGNDIYIMIYAKDKSGVFKSAAETREVAINNYEAFDPAKDKIIMIEVTDMGKLEQQVESQIVKYSDQYGPTVEVGVWSHNGENDGPIGSKKTTGKYADGKQMTLEGWAQIEWNWSYQGLRDICTFYGCNSASNEYDQNFTHNASELDNFWSVYVRGQEVSSYPSTAVEDRESNSNIRDDIHDGFQRYLVGSEDTWNDRLGGIFDDVVPLRLYRNGAFVGTELQDGYNQDDQYTRSDRSRDALNTKKR